MHGSAQTGLVSSFGRKQVFNVRNQRPQFTGPGTQTQQHILPAKTCLIAPEPFSEEPLGSIPVHGTTKKALGNDQTQP
jgi:hypothetical protein